MKILPRSAQVAALVLMSLGMCKLEAQTCSAYSLASFAESPSGYCRSGQNYTGFYYNISMTGFIYCPNTNACPSAHNLAASALGAGACSVIYPGGIPPYVGTSTCPGAYCQQAYYSDVGLWYWYGLAFPYPADTVLFGSPWSCTYGTTTVACH
jgi:hypothetical protein